MENILNLKRNKRESAEEGMGRARRKSGVKSLLKNALILMVAGAVVIFGYVAIAIPRDWQAVFLTNDQVYFGHLAYWPLRSTATLKDVYYLQVAQSLQQQSGKDDEPGIEIVKLGNEIHGPKDLMIIPKGQIRFWENLKKDSIVMRSILEAEKTR